MMQLLIDSNPPSNELQCGPFDMVKCADFSQPLLAALGLLGMTWSDGDPTYVDFPKDCDDAGRGADDADGGVGGGDGNSRDKDQSVGPVTEMVRSPK